MTQNNPKKEVWGSIDGDLGNSPVLEAPYYFGQQAAQPAAPKPENPPKKEEKQA